MVSQDDDCLLPLSTAPELVNPSWGADATCRFYDHGCEWVKVCCEPGDLILWDSRAMHYNVRPTGNRDRTCAYICMAPAKLLSAKDKAARQVAFEQYLGTVSLPRGIPDGRQPWLI